MKWERRKQYPKNWEQLARQCKEQAGGHASFATLNKARNARPDEQERCIPSTCMQPTLSMILATRYLRSSACVLLAMAYTIISTG